MIDMPDKNTIRKMTDKELRSLLEKAREELDRRQRETKEKDWLAVREAITNFIEKWGWITVTDDYDAITINKGADMDTISDINMSC